MQIYSDVTGLPIHIPASSFVPSFGSAMHGAVAAGAAAGGFDSIVEASHKMARLRDESYHPITENQAVYDRLYPEYALLHDYFGRGANDVMKRLKQIKAQARNG